MGGANARTPEYGGIHAEMGVDFLLISIVAGLFGFTGLARGSATIAKILFFLFLVIFIIVLILAITAGEIIL
jgi:uncharacterized membrane protein YtjA (UPF0391 family)